MTCGKVFAFFLLLFGFAAVGYSLELEKCDCQAERIPKHCYNLCRSFTQPPPPTPYAILKKSSPFPGYGFDKEKKNPRPPAPEVTEPPSPPPQRIGPCRKGNCPVEQESVQPPAGWGGDCYNEDCKQGVQPRPPQNSRQRRKLGDFYKLNRHGKKPVEIDFPTVMRTRFENKTVPGWVSNCTKGDCSQGKQPPPKYLPHCNWRQGGRNSSSYNSPYILQFASGGVNRIKPSNDLTSQPLQYQACLKDGTCGCWGGDQNYLSWQEKQNKENSACEPYGCGYQYGSSCGHKWTELYADYKRYPGHTRIDFATKSEILRVMPHIDLNFANVLFFVEPGFARYIIKKHMDLPNLLFYMDEPVLYKMIGTVPNLDNRISGFTPVEISNVFCRVYDQCHFMEKFSKKSQDTIIFKVKYLKHCREKKVITPIVTTTTAPAPNPYQEVFITESQIVEIEAKIPKFRALLPRITNKGARLVSAQFKNIANLFLDLPESVITQINNFLDASVGKLDDISNEDIAKEMMGSKNDVKSLIVKRLFE
nr:expressed protein [Hymenolepis microstoma]